MARVVPSDVVAFIDNIFPWARKQERGKSIELEWVYARELSAILDLIDRIPEELITLNAADHMTFVACIAAIRTSIDIWRMRGATDPLSRIRGLENLNPVTIIRRCLASCRDKAPSPSTTALSFIRENEFRESLRTDISAANTALSNAEWKAATVLAGAAIEALLLWALGQRQEEVANAKNNPKRPLNEWNLSQYIAVAEELKVINSDTATEARLAKDFRNLIHPGRSERLGQVCDRGTALAALAALEHVVRDLSDQ